MSTNDEPETTDVKEEVSTQDDEQLRQDLKDSLTNDTKAEVKETETVTNTETAEAKEEVKTDPEATLTTEPEKDLDWYKKAYENSTTEALRLKGELDKKVEAPLPPVDGTMTTEQLYIRTQLIKESDEAFKAILAKYPGVNDVRDNFKTTSEQLTKVIVDTEKRFPQAMELYEKTAIILGLQPDNSEALGAAIKTGAETPRTSSGPATPPQKSKVTEEMIAMNLKMYPKKSREEIIAELEPHIT